MINLKFTNCNYNCISVVPVYIPASTQTEETSTRDFGTQSGDQPMFSIQNIVNDPQGIHFYTGLENYQNFKFALDTLGVAAYHLNYYDGTLPNIGIGDQLFCTLIKLRSKNCQQTSSY